LAFPNAYLEVDEPPNRIPRQKILALGGMIGLVCFSLIILALHFEPTGYNPVTQVVSDYAVGPFGSVMSVGFVAGGVGLSLLGVALVLAEMEPRAFRVGAYMVLIAGLALFFVGAFPTDLEGQATTFHGTVHSLLSQIVFSFGPIGMLLITFSYGKRWFALMLPIYLGTGAFLAANLSLSLGVSGLAERFFIVLLLGWWIALSYHAFRDRLP